MRHRSPNLVECFRGVSFLFGQQNSGAEGNHKTNILLYYLVDKFKGCPLSKITPLSEINLEKNMVEKIEKYSEWRYKYLFWY